MPLVEVLGTSRSHATPGWAYVPDTRGGGASLHAAAASKSTTTGRKRGIREPGGRTDLTSRQNHAIIRHLAELDRENHRDNVHVPVPVRKDAVQRDNNARAAKSKTSSNVRRILQSQKTFRNYLDDEEAAMAQQSGSSAGGNVGVVGGGGGGGGGGGATAAAGTAVSKVARIAGRRSVTPITPKQEVSSDRQKRAMARKSTTTTTTTTTTTAGKQKSQKKVVVDDATTAKTEPDETTNDQVSTKKEKEGEGEGEGDNDAMQIDSPDSPPVIVKGLIKTAYDNEHLLKSYIPNPPSDQLMAALLAEPPLRYHAARAGPSTAGKPPRHFCTICGYWGKIKCRNCGVRTCGLECYKVHEDSRCGAFF